PSVAARHVIERGLEGTVVPAAPEKPGVGDGRTADAVASAFVEAFTTRFVDAAAVLDDRAVSDLLDETVSRGSFEAIASSLLFPALTALGEAWADGRVGVAGEHMASHMVLRRLGAALEATGHQKDVLRPILVGLPPGSRHELGALAFAIAARRAGLPVTYLGPDLPEADWVDAADHARIAVVGVVTAADRPAAADVVRRLRDARPGLIVAIGGRAAEPVDGAMILPNDLDGAIGALKAALAQTS
ncbi:MAG TPA: B12-binding domain-containing protein, partial [Candidatus Deferrimicrobiaceae bacterium]|nr:B12-binding domain-containing protein [Candidatus Deferrimicrobiaceae bacterium]